MPTTTMRISLPLCCCVFLASCFHQEYDYKENHPIFFEHDRKHDHANHNHGGSRHSAENNGGFGNVVDGLEDKDRVIWQKPDKVIEMLGDLNGKTVADIGAGTGYFTFRMAQEAGRVLAIDVNPQFLEYMDSVKLKFPEQVQQRIEFRRAALDAPLLEADEADAVILVNTYAYIQNRVDYFRKVLQGMKPGGSLLIVDFKRKRLPDGQVPPVELRISADSVETELEMAGFRLMETDDTTLDYQYIVLVSKP